MTRGTLAARYAQGALDDRPPVAFAATSEPAGKREGVTLPNVDPSPRGHEVFVLFVLFGRFPLK
jgi:hypothetical protein